MSVDSLAAVAGSLKKKSGSQSSPGTLERVSESVLQSVWNVMESLSQPHGLISSSSSSFSSSSNLTQEEAEQVSPDSPPGKIAE